MIGTGRLAEGGVEPRRVGAEGLISEIKNFARFGEEVTKIATRGPGPGKYPSWVDDQQRKGMKAAATLIAWNVTLDLDRGERGAPPGKRWDWAAIGKRRS